MRRKKRKGSLKIYNGDVDSITFKPLFFIDFEYITASYRDNGHRKHIQEIIEVAAIVLKEDGYIKFNEIVKPKLYLDFNKKTDFYKIDLDELNKGIELHNVVSFFRLNYKPGVTKIISWGNSDLYNINNLCKIYGIQFHIRKDDYIDLSQKFRRFYDLRQAITLEKALSFKNITDNYKKHRALPDTEMLFELFNSMVEDGYLDEDIIKGD